MRVESDGNGRFIIARGPEYRASAFCFFVDHDRSSWCLAIQSWNTHHFSSEKEAEDVIVELKKRARIRREERAHA